MVVKYQTGCHLVLCLEDVCYVEPYHPNHFFHQFGYGQLYVGNPNKLIRFEGNLFQGTWVWYHLIAGGTNARFSMPLKTLNLYTSFSFCSWYSIACWVPHNFNVNNTCLRDIKVWYSKKEGSSTRVPSLDEFDHGHNSDEDEPSDNMDTAAISADQPEAPAVTVLASPVVKGPSSGLKSPSQNIIIKMKVKKRTCDLPVIPKSVSAEASTVVLSSTFETVKKN